MPATSRPRRASGAPALGVLVAALALLVALVGPLAAQPAGPVRQDAPVPGAEPATIAGPPPALTSTSREIPRLAVEIYDSVLSPFCPGLLLTNCPSPAADSLRKAIADRVERGATRAEIEAELYATYGESIRGAPKASGFGLVAWLAPAVALLGGGLWIALWLRGAAARRDRHAAARPAAPPTLVTAGAEAARAEELARLDRLVRGEGRR